MSEKRRSSRFSTYPKRSSRLKVNNSYLNLFLAEVEPQRLTRNEQKEFEFQGSFGGQELKK